MNSCVLLLFYRNCRYSKYTLNGIIFPYRFSLKPETTMKVTNDTVTISGLGLTGDATVQLKDVDSNELQLFIEKMPASVKGKTVKYNF